MSGFRQRANDSSSIFECSMAFTSHPGFGTSLTITERVCNLLEITKSLLLLINLVPYAKKLSGDFPSLVEKEQSILADQYSRLVHGYCVLCSHHLVYPG
jgi:hypothetical protein